MKHFGYFIWASLTLGWGTYGILILIKHPDPVPLILLQALTIGLSFTAFVFICISFAKNKS